MNKIYTITSITKDKKNSRCFGFFFNESSARTAVINNSGGLEECLYDYIVIEEQGQGIHAMAKPVQWYRWLGNHELDEVEGCWIECDRPESFSPCVVNWNAVG